MAIYFRTEIILTDMLGATPAMMINRLGDCIEVLHLNKKQTSLVIGISST